MAKSAAKTPIKATRKAATQPRSKRPRSKRPTLAELNAWLTQNHAALLKKARANCVRLTGKPTFGGTGRRKSA